MSGFETIDSIFFQIKRFIWPVIFLFTGFYLLSIATETQNIELNNGTIMAVKQSSWFLWASLLWILGTVIWTLYLLGVIKTMVGYGIMVVMLTLGIVVLYKDYDIIAYDVEQLSTWNMMDGDIKARMNDIKEAELAYKEANGRYTNNMDELIDFVRTGTKMTIKKIGALPERKPTPEEYKLIYGDNRAIDYNMTEIEAYAIVKKSAVVPEDLVGFLRDTAFIPVLDAIFNDPKYIENRDKSGCDLAFHPDSLRYVPYSKILVELDTASLLKGEIKVSTLQIAMIHPMDSTLYQIGDVNDNHLRENWKK